MTIENKFPENELDMGNIIIGIKSSPLPKQAIQEATEIVRKISMEIESLIHTGKLKAPEANFEADITNFVMDLIKPVLVMYEIPNPNCRDTARNIYDAIGGKRPSNYEVTNDLKKREDQR